MNKSSPQLHEPSKTEYVKESEVVPGGEEGSLFSALALVRRVVFWHRYALPEADLPDIAQEAVVRLWRWRRKYREKACGMTEPEWDSFTAKTAQNEINRYLSSYLRKKESALNEDTLPGTISPAGDSDTEMISLVRDSWQEICTLTLYQRRALLLGSPELLTYLVEFGVSEKAIVASLDISEEDWSGMYARLPLSDREIAAIAASSRTKGDPEAATRAIGKARFDARKKLERLRR